MGLENFISDDEETYHENPTLDKEKLHKNGLCPACGQEAEHVREIEYRCNNDCDVVYYIITNFDKDNA